MSPLRVKRSTYHKRTISGVDQCLVVGVCLPSHVLANRVGGWRARLRTEGETYVMLVAEWVTVLIYHCATEQHHLFTTLKYV